MTSKFSKKFGEKVKKARTSDERWATSAYKLTRDMSILLEELGIFKNDEIVQTKTLYNYENGKVEISLERALILAAILNLTLDDLIPRELAIYLLEESPR